MLAGASLREERIEGIVTAANRLITGHLSIWLDAVLEAEELPARIANLDTSLSEMKAEDLTHGCKVEESGEKSKKFRWET